MPYIKQKDRDKLDTVINELVSIIRGIPNKVDENGVEVINLDYPGMLGKDAENLDGLLNYCFFKICKSCYPQKYHWFNRMIGMMECCKAELYRKLVAPYEDIKASENGEVDYAKRPGE